MSILNCAYESFYEIEINFSPQLSILNHESLNIVNYFTSLLLWISRHGDLEMNSELTVIIESSHKIWNFAILFIISLNKLLNKHWSCWWFEMPCDITVNVVMFFLLLN